MITDPLFPVTDADVAVTPDEWYTPRWLFDAAGIMFDMDVCAPIMPEFRTCPALRYLTATDDGLMQPWEGLIWCNPPFSNTLPWSERFSQHPAGLILLPLHKRTAGIRPVSKSADAITLLQLNFSRPDGCSVDVPFRTMLAARGEQAVGALARVARLDRHMEGSYFVSTVSNRHMKDLGARARAEPHFVRRGGIGRRGRLPSAVY